MTSPRKLAANRINGRKSRGPRTPAGRAAASRNALRHGITTVNYRNPAFAKDIEEMATMVCEGNESPYLFQHALVIAECALVLNLIRQERVAVIERCRNGRAVALAKGNKSLSIARARARQTRLAGGEFDRMGITLNPDGVDIPDELFDDTTRHQFEPLEPHPPVRDEIGAYCEAIPDLKKLERYERRTWSRQKSAIRDFLGMVPEQPMQE